uniref:RING-type domain-containing protein n=1 Tax=viral metagenome TaxID=1070528 RepID=A0A6C0H6I5_9ZZZZ
MFENIEEIEKKYKIKFSDIIEYDETMVLSIFNSLEMGEEEYDLDNSNMLVVIGLYYFHIKKDYKNAKTYYLMASEKGNYEGTHKLGYLYYNIENDRMNAKKCYLMVIEKGIEKGMYNLGYLYYKEKDYDNAKKYYLMAIEKGHVISMYNLGEIYHSVEKDYDNAKKYYLMAIEKGYVNAMNNLGSLYYNKKDNVNAKKYWLMAIEKGCANAINNIKRIMNEIELYFCLKEMENKNELIENEIKRLKKTKKVNEYENKLIYFGELNNIKNCEICLDNDKLHLLMECGRHDICKDCFIKVEKCPYCRN